MTCGHILLLLREREGALGRWLQLLELFWQILLIILGRSPSEVFVLQQLGLQLELEDVLARLNMVLLNELLEVHERLVHLIKDPLLASFDTEIIQELGSLRVIIGSLPWLRTTHEGRHPVVADALLRVLLVN